MRVIVFVIFVVDVIVDVVVDVVILVLIGRIGAFVVESVPIFPVIIIISTGVVWISIGGTDVSHEEVDEYPESESESDESQSVRVGRIRLGMEKSPEEHDELSVLSSESLEYSIYPCCEWTCPCSCASLV